MGKPWKGTLLIIANLIRPLIYFNLILLIFHTNNRTIIISVAISNFERPLKLYINIYQSYTDNTLLLSTLIAIQKQEPPNLPSRERLALFVHGVCDFSKDL